MKKLKIEIEVPDERALNIRNDLAELNSLGKVFIIFTASDNMHLTITDITSNFYSNELEGF